MNNPKRVLTSCDRQAEEARVHVAALEILSRLKTGEYSKRLDAFLSMHPQYEQHRSKLLREGKLALAACAISAYCSLLGKVGNSLDIARYIEYALFDAESKRRREKGKNVLSSTSGGSSKIEDYLTVFRYVLTRTERLAACGASCIPTPLRSVAYLMVKNAMLGRSKRSDGFGDTVHLLEELILPILAATFHQFSTPCEEMPFHYPRFDHRLYST